MSWPGRSCGRGSLWSFGSVANGGKCAFDWVAGPDVFPMLGGEIVEGQEHVPILDQFADGPVIFCTINLDEKAEGHLGVLFGFGHL